MKGYAQHHPGTTDLFITNLYAVNTSHAIITLCGSHYYVVYTKDVDEITMRPPSP